MRKTNRECIRELLALAMSAKERGSNLKSVFGEIAKKYGMTEKSVRNLYYKAVKVCSPSTAAVLNPKKIVPFGEDEERILVREILMRIKDGKSVRQAVFDYAGDDRVLALRYQNKFRNIKSKNSALICDVAKSLKIGSENFAIFKGKKDFSPYIEVVSREIDNLYERMKQNYIRREKQLVQENEALKREIERLNLKIAMFKSQFSVVDKNIV